MTHAYRGDALARNGELILIALLAAILLGFVAASRYAHPVTDDLDFAVTTRQSGFLHAWKQQYLEWNGRFGSNLLALASPVLVASLTRYRMALASIVLAATAALYWLVATLADGVWTRREVVTSTLALMAVYLSQMPGLGEGMFWYTSSVIYQAAVVLALAHFASLFRFVRTGRRRWLLLASALLAVATGFNEVMMAMLVVFYILLLTWSIRSNPALRALFACQLVIAIVGAAIVVLSPGNAVRETMYAGRHQLVRSLAMTGLQTVRFLGDWMSSGALLIASVLFAPMGFRLGRRFAPEPPQRLAILAFSVVGMVLSVPIVVFPTYWATGMLGGHRTVNTGFFVFLLLWFVTFAVWMAGSRHANLLQSIAREFRVPLAILLIAGLTVTRNSYALGLDAISGRLSAFDAEMRQREASLLSCQSKREQVCIISKLQAKPSSLFVLDLSCNPHDWVNAVYARYYRLAAVIGQTASQR